MTMGGNCNNGNNNGQFGDTTLTKVFVGGLAWETPKEAMRHHFERFGDILEAVIISDKLTGRSKGYGFVTFKEPEAAKKACEDATPIINGRRANCNLAALGARRLPRSLSATPPLQPVGPNNGGGLRPATTPAHAGHVQWYYPASGAPAATASFHAHQHHQPIPFYGYSPAYIAPDANYNHKLSYNGGAYMNGQYSTAGQAMMGVQMPMYPFYYHQAHQSHQASMGLPSQIYPTTSVGPSPITAPLPIISKPTSVSINPPPVCFTVE